VNNSNLRYGTGGPADERTDEARRRSLGLLNLEHRNLFSLFLAFVRTAHHLDKASSRGSPSKVCQVTAGMASLQKLQKPDESIPKAGWHDKLSAKMAIDDPTVPRMVLIVDSDLEFAQHLAYLLLLNDYTVIQAINSTQAETLIDHFGLRIDLAIIEITPREEKGGERDGLELFEKLKRRNFSAEIIGDFIWRQVQYGTGNCDRRRWNIG
jgi:hypothetical protein